jgi:hypothetical protein
MKRASLHNMNNMPYDDLFIIHDLLQQSDILSSKKFSFSGIFFDLKSFFQNIITV